jgi:arylsulfatase A-like enzyme
LVVICCALVLAAVPPSATIPAEGHALTAAVADERPNILVIISDDQAWSDFSPALMPRVFSDLVGQGALFKRAYVNTSLCCPSRSQILTGLYEHHTGVDTNIVPLDRPTIVQALHDVGYHTMLAGKYLNSWPCAPRAEFDRWACVGTPEPSTYSMIDPLINEDGAWRRYAGFQTDILASQVVDFIHATPHSQPFFAMYSPTTPHLPSDDPRYDSMPVTPPRAASFDENTLVDSAPMYERRPPLTTGEIAGADGRFTKMAHGVRSLDDSVGTILDGLGDRAQNTIVIYLSDNGFLFGEHRRFGKTDAYEESVRVPMVIRYPVMLAATDAFASHALVSNVDIAPTLAELAGFPWQADGRSLVRVLNGSAGSVRAALLIEHCQGVSLGSVPCSGLSFYAHQSRAGGYVGVVTSRYKYVRYDDGDRQLFDLETDPAELDNLVGAPGSGPTLASMETKLTSLLEPNPATTIVTGPWPTGDPTSRVAAFTFFSPSRFSTYRCRLIRDGTPDVWHACDGQSDVIGGLPDGDYVFQVAGVDELGNVDATPAARSFTVGSSGPAVSIDAHPPAAQSSGSAAFGFSSTVSGAKFECRLSLWDGSEGDWVPCGSETVSTYPDLTEGRWSFEVRAQDPASGNWSQPPAEWLVDVDITGPSFAMAQGPLSLTSSRSADIRLIPLEAVKGTVLCRLGGNALVDCSHGRFTVTGLTKGPHTLRVTASDALGNTASTSFTWVVDFGVPRVRFDRSPDRFTSSTTAAFRLSSRSDPVLFLCTLDDLPEMPCDSNEIFGPLPDGPHQLTVWGLDAAMNRSDAFSYQWDVDTIPPGLILTGTPEDGAVTPDPSAVFDIWQSEPGQLYCSLDASEFVACATPVSYLGSADGAHTFQVYVQDLAGNVSITASRSWTVAPNAR